MKLFLGLLFVVAVGCATLDESRPFQSVFSEAEFEPYKRTGTASVSGQAFSKTRGGDVKYGAGVDIFLVPRTPYSRELLRARSEESQKLFPQRITADGRLGSYQRKTVADGTGNFGFSEIPAGDYWLECTITWEVPGQYGLHTTGGTIRKELTVTDGQTLKIMLAP